jgi:hypothetical protein
VLISRSLFLSFEALAALAIALWLALPGQFDIAFRVSRNLHVGVSLRQVASLLVLASAGVLSIVALARLAYSLIAISGRQ